MPGRRLSRIRDGGPGAARQRRRVHDIGVHEVPPPSSSSADCARTVRVTGIGGTGVVTVSQILATAAVLDGHCARTVDMTGLAQKGGAVVSDLKISTGPVEQAAKVATGDCDVSGVRPTGRHRPGQPEGGLTGQDGGRCLDDEGADGRNGHLSTQVGFPQPTRCTLLIEESVARAVYLNAGALSAELFDDEQYANMLMVGAAYQTGALGITAESIERAVALNGVAVEANTQAFRRGRCRRRPASTGAGRRGMSPWRGRVMNRANRHELP